MRLSAELLFACFLAVVSLVMTGWFLWYGPRQPFLLGAYAGASLYAAVDFWRLARSHPNRD